MSAGATTPSTETLPSLSQSLLDAVGQGDRSVFSRLLADDGLFTDEDGATRTKAELIELISPLPSGITGQIRLVAPRIAQTGDTAILTYDAIEDETYFGQVLHAHYHTTDMYRWVQDRWQIFGSQTTVIPSEPKAYGPARSVSGLEGDYEMAEGRVGHVSLDGAKVMWSRGGKSPVELLPLGDDVYFQPGVVRGVKIFVRDTSGQATALLDRRDNNDITWKRKN